MMTREEVYEEFKAEWDEFLKGTGLTDPKVREKDMSNNEDLRRVVECNEYILNMLKQESFKPMVEIDLYSVIKQKYIERKVLDKIRAEIEQTSETIDGFLMHDGTKKTVLKIIDKYKESEDKEWE